jgi:hypothetical protein
MRVLATFFTLVFLLCIVVQYNDPDPVFWMLLYGFYWLGALLRLLNVQHPYFLFIWIAGCILSFSYSYWLLPARPDLDDELTREAGGVAIGGFWLLLLLSESYKKARRPSH